MQERYLGDIHDFFKMNFLEFLSKYTEQLIGLNWYLVKPENISKIEVKKNDGEKRSYLYKDEYKEINAHLINELKLYEKLNNRIVNSFTRNIKFKKSVKFYNEYITIEKRTDWFKESKLFFDKTKIIFLDPDNGLGFNKSGNISLKYVNIKELLEYYDLDKTIIFTQFQSFNKNYKTYLNEIILKLEQFGIKMKYPIVRNRSGPNTFYFTLGKKRNSKIYNCLTEYSKNTNKVELVIF
jgi:hypothetical protein